MSVVASAADTTSSDLRVAPGFMRYGVLAGAAARARARARPSCTRAAGATRRRRRSRRARTYVAARDEPRRDLERLRRRSRRVRAPSRRGASPRSPRGTRACPTTSRARSSARPRRGAPASSRGSTERSSGASCASPGPCTTGSSAKRSVDHGASATRRHRRHEEQRRIVRRRRIAAAPRADDGEVAARTDRERIGIRRVERGVVRRRVDVEEIRDAAGAELEDVTDAAALELEERGLVAGERDARDDGAPSFCVTDASRPSRARSSARARGGRAGCGTRDRRAAAASLGVITTTVAGLGHVVGEDLFGREARRRGRRRGPRTSRSPPSSRARRDRTARRTRTSDAARSRSCSVR